MIAFIVWFPAAGLRDRASGGLAEATINGYYWASSIYLSDSYYGGRMYFKNGGVFPYNSGYRSYGFSVRCVSEVAMRKEIFIFDTLFAIGSAASCCLAVE